MRLIRKICKFRQDTTRTRGTRVIVDSRRWLTICQTTTVSSDTEGPRLWYSPHVLHGPTKQGKTLGRDKPNTRIHLGKWRKIVSPAISSFDGNFVPVVGRSVGVSRTLTLKPKPTPREKGFTRLPTKRKLTKSQTKTTTNRDSRRWCSTAAEEEVFRRGFSGVRVETIKQILSTQKWTVGRSYEKNQIHF